MYLATGAVQLQSVNRGVREQHQLHLLQFLPVTSWSRQGHAPGPLQYTNTFFTFHLSVREAGHTLASGFASLSLSHTNVLCDVVDVVEGDASWFLWCASEGVRLVNVPGLQPSGV